MLLRVGVLVRLDEGRGGGGGPGAGGRHPGEDVVPGGEQGGGVQLVRPAGGRLEGGGEGLDDIGLPPRHGEDGPEGGGADAGQARLQGRVEERRDGRLEGETGQAVGSHEAQAGQERRGGNLLQVGSLEISQVRAGPRQQQRRSTHRQPEWSHPGDEGFLQGSH